MDRYCETFIEIGRLHLGCFHLGCFYPVVLNRFTCEENTAGYPIELIRMSIHIITRNERFESTQQIVVHEGKIGTRYGGQSFIHAPLATRLAIYLKANGISFDHRETTNLHYLL